MNMAKLVQPLLAVVVLALGFGTFKYFRGTKPEAEQVERPAEGLMVEVLPVQA
jgi:hypothetical protein